MQAPGVDYDPEALYSPVASKDAIRILLALSTQSALIIEGANVSIA